MTLGRRERALSRSRLFLCATIVFGASVAAAGDAAWCERQWVEQEVIPAGTEAAPRDAELARWLAIADRCDELVAYRARLAMTHANVAQYDEARSDLAKLPAAGNSKDPALVELAGIYIDLAQLMDTADDHLDGGTVRALEDRLMAHLQRYDESNLEDSVEALGLFGSFKGAIGEHEHAVMLLELAERGRKPARGRLAVYRNLAVSYGSLGRYADAEWAGKKALDISPIVMTSPKFVLALAKAQASLGKTSEAQQSLARLIELRPDATRDEEYAGVVEFVRQRVSSRKD